MKPFMRLKDVLVRYARGQRASLSDWRWTTIIGQGSSGVSFVLLVTTFSGTSGMMRILLTEFMTTY